MRMKVLWVLILAIAVVPLASADITLTFSSPVNVVQFYTVDGAPLTVTSNGSSSATVTVDNPACLFCGPYAATEFSDSGVTQVTFSGTPNAYVIDDFVYTTGSDCTYAGFGPATGNDCITLTFDEFNQNNEQVGSFYSGLLGGPAFNNLAQIYSQAYDADGFNTSSYSYQFYPPSSCNGNPGDSSALGAPSSTCSVLFEGTVTHTPEPGTLALFGSGLIGLVGLVRRKLM